MDDLSLGQNIGAGRSEPVGFAPDTLYLAAALYYDHEATQADIAARLGTSRATVSRLLAEARRQGIVRIAVREPGSAENERLARELADAAGLKRVYLSAPLPSPQAEQRGELLGTLLAPALGRALTAARLGAGDVLLVSSGRTLFEVAQCDLPALPGVVVVPTVGGVDQPEVWLQTNEIAHLVAERIGGHAAYLFAPALPGAELYASLLVDPSIQRVLSLWSQAQVVVTGIGGAPAARSAPPRFTTPDAAVLSLAAGDLCWRFFGADGQPVEHPASERLVALTLAQVDAVPIRIGVAAGLHKVTSIRAAAQAGHINQLVTDVATAVELLRLLDAASAVGESPPA